MKNLEFANKKELEQVLVEYMIDNDEDMSIKYTDLYYKFHIMYKKQKYHVSHARQELQFSTIFDLAVYLFDKCDFKLDEVKEVKPTNNRTKTKTTVTVTTNVDVENTTKTTTKRTRKK